MKIEIAVQSVEGARIAADAGADRVELCSALGAVGGLTPSIGMVRACIEAGIPVHPLIRLRPGGFRYVPEEIEVMRRDIIAALSAGAAGVVVGALNPDMSVDGDAVRVFMEAADGAEVTFHRAIDVGPDYDTAIETLIELGVNRILTSGGAARCVDGVDELAEMVRVASGRIQIQAGGGVRPIDVPALRLAGVDAVHYSARRLREDPNPSGPGGGPAAFDVTDAHAVLELTAAVRD